MAVGGLTECQPGVTYEYAMDANLLILGVMNIHYLFCVKLEQPNNWICTHNLTCGSLSAAKSA